MPTNWTFIVKPLNFEVERLDPYVEWALEPPGRPYYFLPGRQEHWIPVLLQLSKDVTPTEFQAGGTFVADKVKWQSSVRVSELFLDGKGGPGGGECPALVTDLFFEELRKNPELRKRVLHLELSLPLDRESLPPFKGP